MSELREWRETVTDFTKHDEVGTKNIRAEVNHPTQEVQNG